MRIQLALPGLFPLVIRFALPDALPEIPQAYQLLREDALALGLGQFQRLNLVGKLPQRGVFFGGEQFPKGEKHTARYVPAEVKSIGVRKKRATAPLLTDFLWYKSVFHPPPQRQAVFCLARSFCSCSYP